MPLARGGGGVTIYDTEGKYSYLKPTDVIAVENSADMEEKPVLLKITNVRIATGQELLSACQDYPPLQQEIEGQISRQLTRADTIQVVEALVVYDWQIEQNHPVL